MPSGRFLVECFFSMYVRRTGVHLMSFDHHASRTFPSKLLVNPLLGPSKEDYAFTPGTQLLLGARYAIIRPEVRFDNNIESRPFEGKHSLFTAALDVILRW